MKILRRIIFFLILLVLLAGIAALFVPWKDVIRDRVVTMLRSRGIEASFTIDRLGLHEVTLSELRLGRDNPLSLQGVTLRYSPQELREGRLQDISLTGLVIDITQTKDGWTVTGLDRKEKEEGGEDIPPPTLDDIVAMIPVGKITLTDSLLTVHGESFEGSVPFSLSLDKIDPAALRLEAQPSTITLGQRAVSLGKVTAALVATGKGSWKGPWTLDGIDAGDDVPVPPMKAAGTIALRGHELTLRGDANDDKRAYKGKFSSVVMLDGAAPPKTTILSASFPFKQGRISTSNVTIGSPLRIPVTVSKVSVDDLLQLVTGKKVTGTGTVSGTVPLIVAKDGSLSFGKGSLKADSTGRISMPGDLIPGQNEQVELVRNILENLHYSLLSAEVENGAGGAMAIRLRLEGNNPDVYNGRAVKLNVNLTGDLLDFVRQNLMLFQTPEKILTQDRQ